MTDKYIFQDLEQTAAEGWPIFVASFSTEELTSDPDEIQSDAIFDWKEAKRIENEIAYIKKEKGGRELYSRYRVMPFDKLWLPHLKKVVRSVVDNPPSSYSEIQQITSSEYLRLRLAQRYL